MGESAGLPPKKDVMMALLEGPSVYLHLDPRREGVVVPKWLTNQPQLVLQVGLNMAVRIPDLDIGDDGVSCTLSFNRSPFWCHLPWTAVYGLVGEDGRGMIWPDDVPEELSGPPRQTRPRLEAVREPEVASAATEPEKAPAKKTRSRAASAPKAPHAASQPKPAVVPALAPSLVEAEAAPPPGSAASDGVEAASGKTEAKGKRPLPPYLRVVK
jgi:stringent starvation protein B